MMMPPRYKKVNSGFFSWFKPKYILLEDWSYYKDDFYIEVKAGFEYDGNSWLFNRQGRISAPALAHDALYRCRGIIDNNKLVDSSKKIWTRKEADILYKELCREYNVNIFREYFYYKGIRLFGEGSWDKKEVKGII